MATLRYVPFFLTHFFIIMVSHLVRTCTCIYLCTIIYIDVVSCVCVCVMYYICMNVLGSMLTVPPQKLSRWFEAQQPQLSPTLQDMVLHELHTNTHNNKNSATDALLWLKRSGSSSALKSIVTYNILYSIPGRVFSSGGEGGESSLLDCCLPPPSDWQ